MNTQRIPSVDPATATGSNKKFFDMLQGALGVIPNMTRSMAQSPAVLEGYISLSGCPEQRNAGQGARRRTGSYAGGNQSLRLLRIRPHGARQVCWPDRDAN